MIAKATKRRARRSKLAIKDPKVILMSRWAEVVSIATWARKEFAYPSVPGINRILDFFLRRLERVLFARGVKDCVAFSKAARSTFLQWIASSPGSIEERRYAARVRKVFGRTLVRTDLKKAAGFNVIRAVLTALTTTRALPYPITLDVTPIVDPPRGEPR